MSDGDTYTAAEAARVIGVSERRVRQLVEDGRIERANADGPLRLAAESVHRERESKRGRVPEGYSGQTRRVRKGSGEGSVTVEQLLELAERITDRSLTRALESAQADRDAARAAADRVEQMLTEQIAAERVRTEQALERVRTLEAELAAASSKRKRLRRR